MSSLRLGFPTKLEELPLQHGTGTKPLPPYVTHTHHAAGHMLGCQCRLHPRPPPPRSVINKERYIKCWRKSLKTLLLPEAVVLLVLEPSHSSLPFLNHGGMNHRREQQYGVSASSDPYGSLTATPLQSMRGVAIRTQTDNNSKFICIPSSTASDQGLNN